MNLAAGCTGKSGANGPTHVEIPIVGEKMAVE